MKIKCYRGISLKPGPKPNEYIALTQWFTRNIKPYTYRKIHYNLWKWLLYEKKVISGSFRVNYWFSSYLFCRDGKSQQSLVLVDVWECRVIKPLEVWNEKKYSWYQAALCYNCLISPDYFIVQNISQFSAPNSNRHYAYVWMMKFKGFFFDTAF